MNPKIPEDENNFPTFHLDECLTLGSLPHRLRRMHKVPKNEIPQNSWNVLEPLRVCGKHFHLTFIVPFPRLVKSSLSYDFSRFSTVFCRQDLNWIFYVCRWRSVLWHLARFFKISSADWTSRFSISWNFIYLCDSSAEWMETRRVAVNDQLELRKIFRAR